MKRTKINVWLGFCRVLGSSEGQKHGQKGSKVKQFFVFFGTPCSIHRVPLLTLWWQIIAQKVTPWAGLCRLRTEVGSRSPHGRWGLSPVSPPFCSEVMWSRQMRSAEKVRISGEGGKTWYLSKKICYHSFCGKKIRPNNTIFLTIAIFTKKSAEMHKIK